jgi:hypothetical protein
LSLIPCNSWDSSGSANDCIAHLKIFECHDIEQNL